MPWWIGGCSLVYLCQGVSWSSLKSKHWWWSCPRCVIVKPLMAQIRCWNFIWSFCDLPEGGRTCKLCQGRLCHKRLSCLSVSCIFSSCSCLPLTGHEGMRFKTAYVSSCERLISETLVTNQLWLSYSVLTLSTWFVSKVGEFTVVFQPLKKIWAWD